MAIYLKEFETMSQYNAYTADTENFILPNVSLTVDNNTVHYNPNSPVPPTPTHDFVEIDGVKWATMNVGANSITDTGLYFQWGDTQGYTADQVGCEEGKKCFDDYFADYKWTEDGGETFTKYNGEDGLTTLQASDDAVTAAWGGSWRMPTAEEFEALGDAVNTAWTANYQGSGVAGLVLTSKSNGATLFFPACGHAYGGSVYDVGSNGGYWSSSLGSDFVSNAYDFSFLSSYVDWDILNYRYYGYPVRGVLGE